MRGSSKAKRLVQHSDGVGVGDGRFYSKEISTEMVPFSLTSPQKEEWHSYCVTQTLIKGLVFLLRSQRVVFLWNQPADLRPADGCLVSNSPPWNCSLTLTAGLKGEGELFKRDQSRDQCGSRTHPASNWFMTVIMWLDSPMARFFTASVHEWTLVAIGLVLPVPLPFRCWNSTTGSHRRWGGFPSFFVFQPCSSISHAHFVAAAICHPVLQKWLLPPPAIRLIPLFHCLFTSFHQSVQHHSCPSLVLATGNNSLSSLSLSLPLFPLLIFQGTSNPQCVVWDYGNPWVILNPFWPSRPCVCERTRCLSRKFSFLVRRLQPWSEHSDEFQLAGVN